MTLERAVLLGLQALVLGLPCMLGGRATWTVAIAAPLVLGLLAVTARERRRLGGPVVPGLRALVAFVALVLLTTLPLPPSLLDRLAPETARLYRDLLPGWPSEGGWSTWRPIAIDPYGAWYELTRIAISIGTFAVVAGYPWRQRDGDNARGAAFGTLLLTVLGGGVLVALWGLVGPLLGRAHTADGQYFGRVSGPFVNPNHFAGWLEMIVPLACAYAVAVGLRVRRRLNRVAERGYGLGVRWRQAWAAALVVHQRRLSLPVVALAAAVVMIIAHRTSGSRGGAAALLAGLAVTAMGMATMRWRRGTPWLPAASAVAVVLVSGALLLHAAASDVRQADIDAVDESLGSRLAASVQGIAILRDHALLGTGLGSWLHAFRLYQAPPVDGATWDHAHNDYVELGAETGVAGLALAVLFGASLLVAAARTDVTPPRRTSHRPPGFEEPEWRAALREESVLRWGLVGGVAAMLVHGLVDFNLRMPANLLLLMTSCGLLALTRPRQARDASRIFTTLVVLLTVAAAPVAANALLEAGGAVPLSPRTQFKRAERILAEHAGGEGAPDAVAAARLVIDRAPVYREAHELLAAALGPGPDGDAPLREAMKLHPCAIELRDRLVERLWARGDRAAALGELEEAVARAPYLAAHVDVIRTALPTDSEALRALLEGNPMALRLAKLDPELASAMQRGLERALAGTPGRLDRLVVIEELVALHEARGAWGEAATLLRAEADSGADRNIDLERAARDFFHAGQANEAEHALVAALLRSPENGDLYRQLAVDVYARRGDFETAERVLRAGERNATNMMPVYVGVTELLARQETWATSRIPRAAEEGETP